MQKYKNLKFDHKVQLDIKKKYFGVLLDFIFAFYRARSVAYKPEIKSPSPLVLHEKIMAEYAV